MPSIEVHRVSGPGFLERVYEEALCLELAKRNIPFEGQAAFDIDYKGDKIGRGRMDILVAKCLIVDTKAVDAFPPIHRAQAVSYLKPTGLKLALLINFNVPIVKQGIKRVLL